MSLEPRRELNPSTIGLSFTQGSLQRGSLAQNKGHGGFSLSRLLAAQGFRCGFHRFSFAGMPEAEEQQCESQ